ncbi:matrixin family metalloprotease, partial [Brevibacillus agri]|uniref:matrixin family metalloprotease n=1 Tax=Brevibacillus agri TaxID=51101 RepID=UPI0028681E50
GQDNFHDRGTSTFFQCLARVMVMNHSKGNLNFDGNNFEDWSLGNIRLNLQQIKNRSSSFKKKVAVHEFGHSLSLAHNMDDVSVMKPGELSFNEPQKADKTHLKNRWK